MKFSKSVLLPVAALILVGAFWAGMAYLKRPNQPAPVASAAATTPSLGRPSSAPDGRQSAATGQQGQSPQSSQAEPAAFNSRPGGGLAQAEGPGPEDAGEVKNPAARTGIYINGREISEQQVEQLRGIYGYVAPPGHYWYDSRSGLYGAMGYEAAGFMRVGHDFGRLPSNASSGNTGVYINGRQINMNEAMYCQRLFGAVYQGHWWLDGRTGNMGAEGNPTPLVNVFVALQQAQRSGQGGSYSWHSNATGASGGSSGGCSYVNIPGSGSVMSGNCD